MFRELVILNAPDGDPWKYRSVVKTGMQEVTSVIVEFCNIDHILGICKELVIEKKMIDIVILCPATPDEIVAKVKEVVGDLAAVTVARGDMPNSLLILKGAIDREEWPAPPGYVPKIGWAMPPGPPPEK